MPPRQPDRPDRRLFCAGAPRLRLLSVTDFPSASVLGWQRSRQEVRAVEIGEHPILDAVGVEVLDSEPWPQDRVGQQTLCESGDRPGFCNIVRVPEPTLVVRPRLSDLQGRRWAAAGRYVSPWPYRFVCETDEMKGGCQ